MTLRCQKNRPKIQNDVRRVSVWCPLDVADARRISSKTRIVRASYPLTMYLWLGYKLIQHLIHCHFGLWTLTRKLTNCYEGGMRRISFPIRWVTRGRGRIYSFYEHTSPSNAKSEKFTNGLVLGRTRPGIDPDTSWFRNENSTHIANMIAIPQHNFVFRGSGLA